MLADSPQVFGTMRKGISQGSKQYPRIAKVRPDFPNASGVVLGKLHLTLWPLDQARDGEVRLGLVICGDGACSGPAAAVRGGKRLVKIEVHDVDPKVSGPGDAKDRVYVGAVHVEERANPMELLADVSNVVLEDPQGVGVRDHHPGDVGAELRAKILHVHRPVLPRLDLAGLESSDGRARGIRAVRAVRDEDHFP